MDIITSLNYDGAGMHYNIPKPSQGNFLGRGVIDDQQKKSLLEKLHQGIFR